MVHYVIRISNHKRPTNKNPMMYPPVLPRRTPMPPLNPANTGTPTAPSNIYISVAIVPLSPPRSKRTKR